MGKFVVQISFYDSAIPRPSYIGEGSNFTVAGESYAPLVEDISKARRFSSYKRALNHSEKRQGANLWGTMTIVEVNE